MWPYVLAFAFVAWMALVENRPWPPTGAGLRPGLTWIAAFLLLSLLIGLRHEVGGDWDSYLLYVDSMQGEGLEEIWRRSDPAYQLLCWIGANVGGGVYLVNLLCASIFSWGLLAFCRRQPRPWLALLVSMPYLVTVVAMGYTRQGVAIGLAMLAITRLDSGHMLRFVGWIALATLFHKSAIIVLPFALFAFQRSKWQTILGLITAGSLVLALPLANYADSLTAGYLDAEYQSEGALIRVIIVAVPAAVLLIYRRRFRFLAGSRTFWPMLAWGALFLLPLVWSSPATTAVDRLALYWLPLQLLVWSQAPEVFAASPRGALLWVAIVTLSSGLMLLTWLFFAEHAHAWLPYQFYPSVVFWR